MFSHIPGCDRDEFTVLATEFTTVPESMHGSSPHPRM